MTDKNKIQIIIDKLLKRKRLVKMMAFAALLSHSGGAFAQQHGEDRPGPKTTLVTKHVQHIETNTDSGLAGIFYSWGNGQDNGIWISGQALSESIADIPDMSETQNAQILENIANNAYQFSKQKNNNFCKLTFQGLVQAVDASNLTKEQEHKFFTSLENQLNQQGRITLNSKLSGHDKHSSSQLSVQKDTLETSKKEATEYTVNSSIGTVSCKIYDEETNISFNTSGSIVSSLMPAIYRTKDSGLLSCGPVEDYEQNYLRSEARRELQRIVGCEIIAQHLKSKDTVTVAEQNFLQSHNEDMEAWGLHSTMENGSLTINQKDPLVKDHDTIKIQINKSNTQERTFCMQTGGRGR